jgi:uncharacterized protein YxjI
MGLLRRNRPERVKFQMRSKLFSIGDDYWIEDDHGHKAFRVDGKSLRVRQTFVIEDAEGNEVVHITGKKLGRDRMEISRGGRDIATVKKALGREKFVVDVEGGKGLDVKGDFLDHEYEIERGRHTIAEVSKKWFRIRDSYGVEIDAGEDVALLLAVTVCVDALFSADL